MNPCIDCHAAMIRRAGEMMAAEGLDFVATGEVRGQRPMSQNAQSLLTVEKASGLKGRLVRPLSAKLLEPTIPELEGKLDRERLLDISGRSRERQIALAAEFGIVDYPSPAGGCKLTEEAFSRRLDDLMRHEGLDDLGLVGMLKYGRRFRLDGGSLVVLGRDRGENEFLEGFRFNGSRLFRPSGGRIGATAFVPRVASPEDAATAQAIVDAYAKGTVPADREPFRRWQII